MRPQTKLTANVIGNIPKNNNMRSEDNKPEKIAEHQMNQNYDKKRLKYQHEWKQMELEHLK